MVRILLRGAFLALAALAWLSPAISEAGPVNLNTWTEESYSPASGLWTVAPGGASVTQSVNGLPTLFYSDFNAYGTDVRGRIRVASNAGDDDFIGFGIGFRPGDASNPAADYLLVDWKRGTQFTNFGAPSNTPGTTALRGLAVSRVTGVPTADEMWGHTDFASDTSGGVVELARGATLGDTGWNYGTTYEFRFIFTSTNLQVFVDDVLQANLNGSFSDGRLAFYNFSQASVTYEAFTRTVVPSVPEPAALPMAVIGLLGMAGAAWRRRGAAVR
jgi:hypothetical protein